MLCSPHSTRHKTQRANPCFPLSRFGSMYSNSRKVTVMKFAFFTDHFAKSLVIAALFVAAIADVSSQAFAQEEDPFGFPVEDPATPAAPSAPSRKSASTDEHPVVASIAESDPKTPAELTRAVSIISDLQMPEKAVGYLRKLNAEELSDQVCYELVMQFGSDTFLRLTKEPAFKPIAAQLMQKVIPASGRYLNSPANLKRLVEQLNDTNGLKRKEGRDALRMAGPQSIAPLMSGILDSTERKHPAIVSLLTTMNKEATAPLLGIANAPESKANAIALQILSRRKDTRGLPIMLTQYLNAEGPKAAALLKMIKRVADAAPSKEVTKLWLKRHLAGLLENAKLVGEDAEQVESWNWKESDRTLTKSIESFGHRSLRESVSVAKALLDYQPESPSAAVRYWTQKLTLDKLSIDAHTALDAKDYPQADVDVIHEVLKQSLKENNVESAIGALDLLKDLGVRRFAAIRRRTSKSRRSSSFIPRPPSRFRSRANNHEMEPNEFFLWFE